MPVTAKSPIVLMRLVLTLIACAAAVVGCGSILGVDSTCRADRGIELCVDRSEYAPGDSVYLRMTNAGAADVARIDQCSIQLSGTAGSTDQLDYVYRPTRRCGFDVTPEIQLQRAFVLSRGESATTALGIARGTPQSFNRVNVWLLDPEGRLVSEEPVYSTVFTILRSARAD